MPVTGDFAGLGALAQALGTLASQGPRLVSKALAAEGKALIQEGFVEGKSPDGARWAPLKVRSGQPLRDTGRLQNSIVVSDTGTGFVAGTNVAYAGVHQSGATIHVKKARVLYSKKLRMAFGKSVSIPARPFLPTGELPAAWAVRLQEAAEDAADVILAKAAE